MLNLDRPSERDIEIAMELGDYSHCTTAEEYWEEVEDFARGLFCGYE